jgi:glutathione S-transferase
MASLVRSLSILPLPIFARRRQIAAMHLYFSPMACSLVVRIVAIETGAALDYKQVELFARTFTDDGSPYLAAAPLGQVPVLVLGNGEQLTEVSAIVQLFADRSPQSMLLAEVGSEARYRTLAWLGFSACELHKRSLWLLANPRAPAAAKAYARTLASEAFDHLEAHLRGREYVATDAFSVADAHLAWVLVVAPLLGAELGERPALRAYAARTAERPSVEQALAIEMPLLRPSLKRQVAFMQAPSGA